MITRKILFIVSTTLLFSVVAVAQKHKKGQHTQSAFDQKYFEAIQWRNIGPFRGGRSAAVTGVPSNPNLFYMGATGGGVWRTSDAGNTWENISDGFFGGSVGAVAVSESDNNVIYVGMGEVTVRGNVSSGHGVWKSVDAGKTWKNVGLLNSRHIPRVRIHPTNPDIVYVAVLGDLYQSSEERGIYKSVDGGKNWKRTLFANKDAGAVDLIIDPNNPRIIYASTWNVRRTPYSLSSGGEGSALWKSVDGGNTWKNISSNIGLPKGIWGIVGVTVSPVNSNVVYALIENNGGGVYKSVDGGKNWKLMNNERDLRQRAWYYSRIYADTKDVNIVYVLNVSYHRSTDGGKTFKAYDAPHGDHHDLWIAPNDNQRMVIADDGGAQISFDAGKNWSSYMNQPTSQFYRVVTDDSFPYRIYGAQQDNTTVRIRHRTNGKYITEKDWETTAGGESAHIAIDPENEDIVYGGSYGGFLTRLNHQTQELRAINIWPDNPLGHAAKDFKYRFQWNFPLFFSPHNPKKLYAASNHLHLTTNEGQSWEIISPDLTRNDTTTLGVSGGPITKDNTGVEYYGTIFAAVESSYEKNLIWTGSDDGLVYVSKNGGEDWTNVTPRSMPKWMMINSIEVDPFHKGGAYIVGTRYKMGDYKPYIYKTSDYGVSWKKITKGIQQEDFTRVVRADPARKGLLYAGTEAGMYTSFDDGEQWQKFQLNLPIVPITDLAIKNNNLIAATQGRSFWMIDDLTPFHQIQNELIKNDFFLFKPMDTYRLRGGKNASSKIYGQNHKGGVLVNYYVQDTLSTDTISLSFYENQGQLIKRYSTFPDEKKKEEKLIVKKGSNQFSWDMTYVGVEKVKGMILWWSLLQGPTALPGTYQVELTKNGKSVKQAFKILKDPRSSATTQDMQAQFDFIVEVRDKLNETHKALKNIKKVKDRITLLKEIIKDHQEYKSLLESADRIFDRISEIEKKLYQTKNRSNQDPINFPIRLNNKLGHLNMLTSIGNYRPTDQAIAFKKEIIKNIDNQLSILYDIFHHDVKALNQEIKQNTVDLIQVD